ncbi:MAG: hypothetical protein EZS28_044250, partial [Streblomastix strix]
QATNKKKPLALFIHKQGKESDSFLSHILCAPGIIDYFSSACLLYGISLPQAQQVPAMCKNILPGFFITGFLQGKVQLFESIKINFYTSTEDYAEEAFGLITDAVEKYSSSQEVLSALGASNEQLNSNGSLVLPLFQVISTFFRLGLSN